MLKKELTVAGVITVRLGPLTDGISKDTIPHLRLMSSAGASLVAHGCVAINAGETLTVIDKPKKRNGINTAIVCTAGGIEGHVYWCELRVNCNHV